MLHHNHFTKKLFMYALIISLLGFANLAKANNCHSFSVNNINFGNYNPKKPSVIVSGIITLSCQGNENYTITANNYSNNNLRAMQAKRNKLLYNVYLDRAATKIFGDGNHGTSIISGTFPIGQAKLTIPFYAKIATSQYLPAATYLDSVTFTLKDAKQNQLISTISPKAIVSGSCSMQPSSSGINFRTYNKQIANASTIVTIQCIAGTEATLKLGIGTAGRNMVNGSNNLLYYLIFGPNPALQLTASTPSKYIYAYTQPVDGLPVTLILNGTIPANQADPAGNYVDTIDITLNY